MRTSPEQSSPVPGTPISSLTSGVDTLFEELENIKSADRTRHDFIEKLIHQIQHLNREREANTKMLRSQEALAVTYQEKYEATMKVLDDLQRTIDCDLFVLVLIDGDNTLFKDEYIRDGLQGGERASRDFQKALFEYFKDKQYFKHDYGIVTRIYMNLAGLSKTYSETNIVPNPATFQYFVQGFNKTHGLAKIIDAGNGKQGADRMIQAEFNLFRRNQHCRQIMLAGAGDNGYGGLLGPYAPNSGKSNKITLIEALPFVRDIQLVSDKFENTRFDGIFRKTKIPSRRVSFYEDLSKVRTPSTDATTLATASSPGVDPNTPPTTYATKVLSVNAGPTTNSSNDTGTKNLEEWKPAPISKSSRPIYLNEFDQRIDVPIKRINGDLARRFKQQKFCNKHHLTRNCTLGEFCQFAHGVPLKADELDHLRYVARLSPCESGLSCRNPDCINGHRCPRGMKCIERHMGKCWFSEEMHEVVSEPQNVKIVMVRH